jgi:hypothetical protein
MGLRLAEQGNLPQAVEAFTQARDLDSSAITDLQWQRLCYFGQVWNETGIVQNACSTAVTAARSSDNVDFTQSVCVLGSTPDLASLVRPACQRLAELAAGTLDAYLALQICQLQNTVTGLEGIVAPICELSSSLTKSIASGGTDTGFIQSGQGEVWVFQGREGQVINIGLTADSGSLDPYLILLDPTGVVIAENNDVTEGVVRDARIEAVTLPTTGSYTIIARGNDDASVGSYTIALR